MPHTDPTRPSELLRRYRRNVYPPSLSEEDQAAVRGYLGEKGLKPVIGVVAEHGQKTEYLVRLALSEMSVKRDLADRAVVGPHSLGMEDAISLWVPEAPEAENPQNPENLDG